MVEWGGGNLSRTEGGTDQHTEGVEVGVLYVWLNEEFLLLIIDY